jgi:membrane-associated PAP2 superfamily phosphatase
MTATDRTPGLRRDLLAAAVALAGLLAWDASGADLIVSRWYGDAHGFAWRDQWLTRALLHDGGRLLAWTLMGLLLVNIARPWAGRLSRAERVRWALATLACALAVPALKHFSHTSCPWDLQEFGAAAAYVPHWAMGRLDGGPGRCFPSGHAVAAFAFFSGHFALRPHHPRAARAWLAVVLAVGAAFGWAQLARGAHYVSHTLWSAWISWLLCAVLAAPGLAPLRRRAARASPG